MWSIENRVNPASSWASTHSRISSSWIDHSSANVSMFDGHEHERRRRTRDRQVVHAERAPGEVADHRADAHAHHRRRHHLAESGHHLGHRIGASVGRQVVGRAERRGEFGEQRPVGVERLLRPLFGRGDGRFDGGNLELHHVGDVEAGDARRVRRT